MKKQIDFYFDLVSPYSYLAASLIDEVVNRNNAKLIWKPILLGGVFKAIEGIMAPGLVPVKKPYLIKDLGRLSAYYQIPLNMPSDFPIRTVLAMRVLSCLSQEKIPQSARLLFRAYWSDNKNIADPEVLSKLIDSESVERASIQETKDTLFNMTKEDIQLGVFGAPTFFIDNEMFFGHDRINLIDEYLQKNINSE